MTDTTATDGGSPGSHLRNWQPGDDDSDELLRQKIADALRDNVAVSDRQLAKFLGITRMRLWYLKKLAAIPDGLFERLLKARVGSKAMTWIGRYCENDDAKPPIEIECCPHCGHELRLRTKSLRRAIDVLNKWIEDGQPDAQTEVDRGPAT